MIQTDKVPLRFEFDISLPSGSATLTPDQKWTKIFLHISHSNFQMCRKNKLTNKRYFTNLKVLGELFFQAD